MSAFDFKEWADTEVKQDSETDAPSEIEEDPEGEPVSVRYS